MSPGVLDGPHAILLPSGDQGWLLSQMSCHQSAVATMCSPVPSAFITLSAAASPFGPSKYSTNASLEPSGDHRGTRAFDFSRTGSLASAATV
jgi:hypothetical protein